MCLMNIIIKKGIAMKWRQQHAVVVVVVSKYWESQHNLLDNDYVNKLALD